MDDEQVLTLVGLLASETYPLVTEQYPEMPTCVLSTAICRDVLGYFDVASSPMSVILICGNDTWVNWMALHDWAPPSSAGLPDGAYSLGVDVTRPAAPNRWNGHLMLSVADGLLDASLGYWSRPEHDIDLPGGSFFVNGPGSYRNAGDRAMVTIIEREPDDRAWAAAVDWTDRRRRKQIVGQLIRQAKAVLG